MFKAVTQAKGADTRAITLAEAETQGRKANKQIQKAEEVGGLNDGVNALFAGASDSAPQQKQKRHLRRQDQSRLKLTHEQVRSSMAGLNIHSASLQINHLT